mmetsp:Transcript_39087/g.91013  ORF Transcript_39087/g.91013 Transcript_39087/m.91013 type:complete len:977 (-) Transcript_39087:358-3288(-)
MIRAHKKKSGLAEIPDEAILCLRPPGDTITSNIGKNQNEIHNPALLPRYNILQEIISTFCHDETGQSNNNNADVDQPDDQPSIYNKRLTLRGMGGSGKTMLAGIAVSLTDLRYTFDYILWLNLGNYFKEGSVRNNLCYDMYLDCLQNLCQQLGVPAKFKRRIFPQPGDSKMKIAAKCVQSLEQSKLEMSKIIDGLKILIVLDDVWSPEDVELFNFGDHNMSSLFGILVTSRTLDLEPSRGCLTIDLGLISREEGIFLFSVEAGLGNSVDAQDIEIIDCILKKCGYLPLAIRTAGRLVKASRKIGPELNTLDILEIVIKMSDSPRMSPVTELLDRSFSFVTNEFASFALKLLFSAFAVVFRRDDILRPWVNLGDIHIVWKALICSHDMIQLQLRSSLREYKLTKIEQIADLMFVMGLLDRKCGKRSSEFHQQKSYRVHHDLMWDYGKMFCSLFRTFDGELVKCEQHGIACCNVCFEGSLDFIFNENNKKWNGIIVEYFQSSAEIKNAKSYELKWLPLHMMKAGLFHEAFDLLTTEEFLENQIEANGIEDGICFMISLVRSYEKMYIADSFPSKTPMITILLHINDFLFRFSSLVQLDDTFKREIGHGIILLGLELQKFSKLLKSIDIFENALNVFSTITCEESDPDIAYALKLIDSCATHNLVLVRQDSPNKLKLKVQDVLNNVQNKTNLCFELSSHPGYTIVEMECKCKFTGIVSYEGVYLGVGSKDNSLMLNYDGQMIRDATCRRTFFAALGCLAEGFPLQLISDFQFGCFIKEHEQVEKVMKCLNAARLYAIADDGSVYPKMAPHLCLGVLYFQSLILVANHSSNRAVFKYYSKLQCSKISNIDNEGKNENNDRSILSSPNADGILLELSSHPGMGIVLLNQASSVPLINGALIGGLAIGPVQHALSAKMNEKNHLMITNYNNGLAFTSGLKENLDIGKNIYISDLLGPWINEFVINDDGTISPLHAKELVFGF